MNMPPQSRSRPQWRLADHDAGSDVGVTYGPQPAADNYDREPDIPVFTVHVWHAATDQCREFAERVCAALNSADIKPPKGWDDK